MDISVEELRELGLMPHDEAIVAAREEKAAGAHQARLDRVEAAKRELEAAEAEVAAHAPASEEVAEPGEEQPQG